ncbi:vesicle associated protein [Culex quinquefasciatus]|uniref:Vesicle associated protein n=1 Tax=Culex quinquefasciatus TaxID=7176 RepID=B0XBX8_CULQU|nr:vesicle associated protein [Culex quinquefasciatus]|eukprot:XP_001867150.1 vesicle associated protein [Culex quinquefasciatus]
MFRHPGNGLSSRDGKRFGPPVDRFLDSLLQKESVLRGTDCLPIMAKRLGPPVDGLRYKVLQEESVHWRTDCLLIMAERIFTNTLQDLTFRRSFRFQHGCALGRTGRNDNIAASQVCDAEPPVLSYYFYHQLRWIPRPYQVRVPGSGLPTKYAFWTRPPLNCYRTQSRQHPGRHLNLQQVNTNRWLTLNNLLHPDHLFPLGATPANQNFRDDHPLATQRVRFSLKTVDRCGQRRTSRATSSTRRSSRVSSDLKLVGSQTSAHRFLKVVWSPLDFGTATNPNGVIVGSCEGDVIQVYSALKLLAWENALMAQQDKHNGAWHSEVATQLWVASEEDQAPSVQLWDLRYATAPNKTFHIHQRDVLGLTWCPKDFALWNFDVAWCPRNPALIAGSSFDGNVTVYLINGGAHAQVQTVNKIADSFPGVDSIEHEPDSRSPSEDLKRPPKWLKRPPGACFGLGGKLDMFNGTSRTVIVNQVVTDCERIERSNRLEQVLAEGTRSDACVRRNLKDCWETSRLDCDAGDI